MHIQVCSLRFVSDLSVTQPAKLPEVVHVELAFFARYKVVCHVMQELLAEKAAMRRIRQLNGGSKRAKVEERRVRFVGCLEGL